MPRLSPLQWLIVVVFLGFYGFAVFALTRDYYVRNPPRTAAANTATAPHGVPGGAPPTWIQRQVQAETETARVKPTGSDAVLLAQQADALFEEKRYDEAIAFYRRIIELKPDDADAYTDLGLALHYTGQSAEALKVLAQGTQKAPEFQRIWLTLGYVSANAGETAQARTALEKAQSLDPTTSVGQEAARLLGLLPAQ